MIQRVMTESVRGAQFGLVVAVSAAGMAAADGSEWARFRGAAGAGAHETKVPVKFDEADYAWAVDLPGPGHSSPVVWGDRVFLTATDPEGKPVRQVLCYSLASGDQLWSAEFPFEPHSLHEFNNMASTTPCADAERVYVSWETGESREVAALTHDGEPVWKRNLGFYAEDHGTAASPQVVEGVLVVPNDYAGEGGAILGLDPATGDDLWAFRRAPEKTGFGTPAVYTPTGGRAQLVVPGCPDALTGIDPRSGEVIWHSRDKFDQRTVASPVVAGDVVFTSSGQGGGGKLAHAVRVGADTRGEVPSLFSLTTGLPYVPTPVVHDGLIFLWTDGGVVQCVRASDGETLWRERASGPCYASPVLAGDVLIGCSKRGEVVALRAGPEFEVLGESNVGDPVHATPALVGDKMLVRTEKRLICVSASAQVRE